MNKLLGLILSFLITSCTTWQKEVVSSTYRCNPTGEIEKNYRKYPLGRDVNIVEIELKEVLRCDEIATYQNVRISKITGKKRRCNENKPKCRERTEEVVVGSTKLSYGRIEKARVLQSDNPDIVVENGSISFYTDSRLAAIANYNIDYVDPNRVNLNKILKSIRCVDPDGTTAVRSNDIDLCLTREVESVDSHHDVKVHIVQ
jgi:hypothetical protein